ncbi:winged helix-turn-helix transcriptional regulator|uniref:Transcriptional regulator, ArsR family n=1 Tax=Dendrosporobacter quercicolus TaxID=146817 RepID=A0A1G9X6S0_9FIRM|nr:metalloregulator ArsR/SmtB family transcription factor [Dendrosporobacter quercicolus]NSL49930.1 winged helix-turn-helix transcriptional regulator [Dendrosporobacter quercicolus DSM 1736]SDM92460.1 transcriptional regulator, ArsR family [Dendrosporobacter quercicolus]
MKKHSCEADMCEQLCEHPQTVCLVKSDMLPEGEMRQITEMFRLLGDMTRFKILQALSKRELCVCDIAAVLQMAQSAVSQQLRLLRGAHLVKYRKEGKLAWYSLNDDHIAVLLQNGMEHIRRSENG